MVAVGPLMGVTIPSPTKGRQGCLAAAVVACSQAGRRDSGSAGCSGGCRGGRRCWGGSSSAATAAVPPPPSWRRGGGDSQGTERRLLRRRWGGTGAARHHHRRCGLGGGQLCCSGSTLQCLRCGLLPQRQHRVVLRATHGRRCPGMGLGDRPQRECRAVLLHQVHDLGVEGVKGVEVYIGWGYLTPKPPQPSAWSECSDGYGSLDADLPHRPLPPGPSPPCPSPPVLTWRRCSCTLSPTPCYHPCYHPLPTLSPRGPASSAHLAEVQQRIALRGGMTHHILVVVLLRYGKKKRPGMKHPAWKKGKHDCPEGRPPYIQLPLHTSSSSSAKQSPL